MNNIITLKQEKVLNLSYVASPSDVAFDDASINAALNQLDVPCYVAVDSNKRIGVSNQAQVNAGGGDGLPVIGFVQPLLPENLGDADFKKQHGVKYAYHAGAMANGIASEEMVIALGKQGILASFGAAGLVPDRVEQAIKTIQAALPNGPYAVNLIHAPKEEALEQGAVERFLKLDVKTVEASAYMGLSEHIVRYRVSGLSQAADGSVVIGHKVIAKVSRTEVAMRFMSPAPTKLLDQLLTKGQITAAQYELAKRVPMADDVTAEADSGGHTDNRSFVALLPAIINVRDEVQASYNYATPIRVGIGGGIGTSQAALAAFNMGAAYIVTGSVNQSCVEAGASEHTRKLLAKAKMTDVMMAPAADMFEMGVKLQVLKSGTLFPMRAQKLYDLYVQYDSIDSIPSDEREKIETQLFRQNLDDVWAGTKAFFQERDPEVLEKAFSDPKRKMALIFRWYLGLSSRWSNTGEAGREMDYQIWAGPALGAFNEWVQGTYLEVYQQRKVVDVADHIMRGAAFEQRINLLRFQGITVNSKYAI
ncbi:MAG: PfaD family polyunsaturated fatty acid/polyketide biosynthesis protein [Pseudomonadota bacterium]